MSIGRLAGIDDPEVMAGIQRNIDHRKYIVMRIAEQMGVDRDAAKQQLWYFENITSSDGHTLH